MTCHLNIGLQNLTMLLHIIQKYTILNKSTNTTRTNGELGGSGDVVYGKLCDTNNLFANIM